MESLEFEHDSLLSSEAGTEVHFRESLGLENIHDVDLLEVLLNTVVKHLSSLFGLFHSFSTAAGTAGENVGEHL